MYRSPVEADRDTEQNWEIKDAQMLKAYPLSL